MAHSFILYHSSLVLRDFLHIQYYRTYSHSISHSPRYRRMWRAPGRLPAPVPALHQHARRLLLPGPRLQALRPWVQGQQPHWYLWRYVWIVLHSSLKAGDLIIFSKLYCQTPKTHLLWSTKTFKRPRSKFLAKAMCDPPKPLVAIAQLASVYLQGLSDIGNCWHRKFFTQSLIQFWSSMSTLQSKKSSL